MLRAMTTWVLVVIYVGICNAEAEPFYKVQTRLKTVLLENYDKTVAPQVHVNDTVALTIGLTLLSIDDLDVERGVLTANVWLNMQWKDARLKWQAMDYNGIESVGLPSDSVWIPDVVPYNNAAQFFGPSTNYLVHTSGYSGDVFYVPHLLLSTMCSIDLKQFPFDQQTCLLKFGSWTHSGDTIKLVARDDNVDISTYQPNNLWDLINSTSKVTATKYECCLEEYYDLTVTLKLRRHTSAIMNIYAGPAACIGLVMPAIFLLPAWSSHKLILGCGLLISQILLLDMIVEILPINDFQAPRLALYYFSNIVLIALTLGMSSVIICLWERAKRGGPGVPACFDQIFLGVFGRLLCVRRDDYVNEHDADNSSKTTQTNLDDQAAIVKEYTSLVAPAEWRQFAVVLDRLLLVVFIVVAIATVVSLMAFPGTA